MRRHILPTPDSPAPRHTGLREPRLGQEEPSTQPESLSSHSSLRAAGLQDLSEEGRSPPPRTSRRWGVVRSWAGGHLLLYMPGLVIVVRRHAFWDSSELLWFLAVVLGGLGDGDQRRNNVFFFTLAGYRPFSLQIPFPVIPASCMPAVASAPRQNEPSLSPLV